MITGGRIAALAHGRPVAFPAQRGRDSVTARAKMIAAAVAASALAADLRYTLKVPQAPQR